jgi:hypothetical protein
MKTHFLMPSPSKIVFAGKTANTSSFCINYEANGNTTWAISRCEHNRAFFYADTEICPLFDTPRVTLTCTELNRTNYVNARRDYGCNEKGVSTLITYYCYLYQTNVNGKLLYMPLYDLLDEYIIDIKSLFTINLN